MTTVDTSGLLTGDSGQEQFNVQRVVCPLCGSAILPPLKGFYEERDFDLFYCQRKKTKEDQKENDPMDKETVKQFYRVDDMFDFDNIGVSKMVGEVSHLLRYT